MFRSRIVVLMGLLCLLVMVGSSIQAEDIYMKRVIHTDPITMGGQTQPASDDTTEIWLSKDAAYTSTPNGNVLVRADKHVMYYMNPEAKTYFEIPMSLLGASKEAIDSMPANPMAAMMGSVTMTVTPTEETKKIGDWNAKKYNVQLNLGFGVSNSEYWTTEDLDADHDIMTAATTAAMSMLPGYEDIVKEVGKIEGVLVESSTEVSMMGAVVKSYDKLIDFSKKNAPAGTFEIPEGYTKSDMHPGLQGMH